MLKGLAAPLLAGALLTAPAAAAEPRVAIDGAPAAGPARYDKTWVTRYGPRSADTVMVLSPGFLGGAANFQALARDLVRRVDDLQVWAWDRRSNAFEDTFGFRGDDPDRAFRYYAQFQPVDGRRHTPLQGAADAPFAREWGLTVALNDLRRVVLAARRGGRKVILGGHSLGASTAATYATWDFRGRPGYRDIDALVLIDGGMLGTFATPSLRRARQRLAELRRGDPFVDIIGRGLPWEAGVFVELGALYALERPNAPSTLQAAPGVLPAAFKPGFTVTNEALFGFNFDKGTSQDSLSFIHLNAGRLAPSGDPRRWRSGELTPLRRAARTFAVRDGNAAEWYFPKRLPLEVDAANRLEPNALTRLFGLRPFHLADVDVPLFAFQTDLTGGRVLRGARRYIRASDIKRWVLLSDTSQSHIDPLVASPRKNRFLRRLVPFVEEVTAGRRR